MKIVKNKQSFMNLQDRYTPEKYGERTAETMSFFISSMKQMFTEIDPAWIPSLDQLAMNYKLMFEAYDDITKNGNTSKASRERLSRNPSIGLFLNCQNAIQSILSKTGLTVISKARVQQLTREDFEKDDFAEKFITD